MDTPISTPTFIKVIEDIINTFDTNYTTLGSLHQIVSLLNQISPEEKSLYREKINYFVNVIKEFGAPKNSDKLLTTNQYKRISSILNQIAEVEKINSKISSIIPSKIPSSSKSIYKPSYGYFPPFPIYKTIPKFTQDDLITQMVFGLLTNLNHHGLTSSINVMVYDFFEMTEFILFEDSQKYEGIVGEIGICLEKHGWVMKNEKTLGGFNTEPDRLILSQDLQQIVNKYF